MKNALQAFCLQRVLFLFYCFAHRAFQRLIKLCQVRPVYKGVVAQRGDGQVCPALAPEPPAPGEPGVGISGRRRGISQRGVAQPGQGGNKQQVQPVAVVKAAFGFGTLLFRGGVFEIWIERKLCS